MFNISCVLPLFTFYLFPSYSVSSFSVAQDKNEFRKKQETYDVTKNMIVETVAKREYSKR